MATTNSVSLEDFHAGPQETVSLDSFHAGDDALDTGAKQQQGWEGAGRSAASAVGKVADMVAGLPADIAGLYANVSGRFEENAARSVAGKPLIGLEARKATSVAGTKAEEEAALPGWFKQPITSLINAFNLGTGVESQDLVSKHIDDFAERLEKRTNGGVLAEDVKQSLRFGMDAAGVAGIRAVAGRLYGKVKAGEGAPRGESSGAPQLENVSSLDDFMAPEPKRAALERPVIEGESRRIDDEAPRLTERGAADPKLLAAIAAGGGLGLWAAANPEAAKDAAMGGLLLGGAIKPKGGMWHPEAVERLSKAIQPDLYDAADHGVQRTPETQRMYEENVARTEPGAKPLRVWAPTAVSRYLNKHAGTETDSLRDVEIPFGEGTKRWEEVTDKAFVGKAAELWRIAPKTPRPDDIVYGTNELLRGRGYEADEVNPAVPALTSYLSHVGDYLREHVPPDKLPQYDLVRAVKETSAWDKELAKRMDKERADDTKSATLYKDYGDGVRWIQLDKPGQFARESDAMGHSVRGYEPPRSNGGYRQPEGMNYPTDAQHPDWVPASRDSGHAGYGLGGWEAIKRGDAKVYSLRDAKGKSLATMEVGKFDKKAREIMEDNPEHYPQGPDIERITQIKGPQNRAPSAAALPYVQDFVRSGKWGEVGDLGNTGLLKHGDEFITKEEAHQRIVEAGIADKFKPDSGTAQRLAARDEGTLPGLLDLVPPRRGLRSQRGSIDPKLLLRMGAMAAGAVIGANVSDQHPITGALLGALLAGGATKLSPRAAAQAVKSAFAPDPRIRITKLADKWEGDIAKASRAVWQQQMDVVDLAKDTKDRVALTHAIQGNTPIPSRLAAAAAKAREFFSAMGKAGQDSSVLKDLIDNYVTNLWDLGGKNKAKWEDILNRAGGPSMSPESRFALKRRIQSLEQGKALGLEPRTEDIAEIMGIYGNSLTRSIANRQLLESLKSERGPNGERLVMPSASAPHSYVSIDHPVMTGRRVHPDIAPSLKFIFDNRDPGVIMNGLSAINTAIKRGAVSFSLFHAKALTDALIGAAENPLKAGKILVTSALGTNEYLQMLRKGGAGDLVDKALEGGLKFSMEKGKLADEDVGGSFYSGLKMAQEGLDSLVPGLGLPIKGVTKLNHLVDTFMWERLHAGMKLSLFAEKFEILQRNGVPEAKAKADAASFANDTFGGLNWRRIAEAAKTKWGRDIALAAYGPTGRRWLQLLMFAPDWTLSTTRAALKAFGAAAGYESGSGLGGILKPKNVTDLHRQYLLRSALYYGLVGTGINYALTGHFLWDNKDPTTIELGDGRTMQWSKHTMEPVHWLTKPGQQALNKLGFFPREAANQMLGTEYLSAAGKSPPMDTLAAGRAEHVLKSVTPIAGQQSFGANATPGSALAGALGAPIYGKTDEQRAAAKEAAKERARQKRLDKKISDEGDDSSFAKKMQAITARDDFRASSRQELINEAYRRLGRRGIRDFQLEEEQSEIRKARPPKRSFAT